MQSDIEVLVLCGGEGKRLRSMISDVPKPMAPIGNKPFLDHLVQSVSSQGFKNFCFLTGYKADNITSYFQNNFKDLAIRFSVEEIPLGTGGAIFQALKSSSFKKFLVLNGDTFFNIDLAPFTKNWSEGTVKIALKITEDVSRYGQVKTDKQGKVLSFVEKGASQKTSEMSLINGGIYVLDNSILSLSNGENKFISFENDVFPQLLTNEKIYSESFDDDFIDIGVPEDYIRASELIEKWVKKAR